MLSLKTVLVILVTLIFCSCKEQSKENAMQDTIAYKGNDTTVQKSDTIKPKDIKVVKLEVKGKNEFIIRDFFYNSNIILPVIFKFFIINLQIF